MQKQKVPVAAILASCLLVTTLVFFGLWQSARHDQSDLRRLAQAGASEAYQSFSDFQARGAQSDYWHGVAAFRSYENAYTLLTDGTNKAADRIFVNEIYGSLVLSPERSGQHIAELLEVLALLTEDVEDPNAYARMSDLRNFLQE